MKRWSKTYALVAFVAALTGKKIFPKYLLGITKTKFI